jgi:hypothetical protein
VLAERKLANGLAVFLCGFNDLLGSVTVDTGKHSCVGQGTMSVWLAAPLAVSRNITTTNAAAITVGKMTAKK